MRPSYYSIRPSIKKYHGWVDLDSADLFSSWLGGLQVSILRSRLSSRLLSEPSCDLSSTHADLQGQRETQGTEKNQGIRDTPGNKHYRISCYKETLITSTESLSPNTVPWVEKDLTYLQCFVFSQDLMLPFR